MNCQTGFAGILLCFLNISGIYGFNVHFYRDDKGIGYLYENQSGYHCFNFPQEEVLQIDRIVTDTCLVVYEDSNCKGSWNATITPLNQTEPLVSPIGSFRICNNEGRSVLNVDIIPYYEGEWRAPLKSYENVCSCVDLPEKLLRMKKWSINNHGNEMMVYFEQDCSQVRFTAKYIAGGYNNDSRDVYQFSRKNIDTGQVYYVQSFGPDLRSTYFKTTCASKRKVARYEPKRKGQFWKNFIDKLQYYFPVAFQHANKTASILELLQPIYSSETKLGFTLELYNEKSH